MDLFADERRAVALGPGAVLLGGFALPVAEGLMAGIEAVGRVAPFRHMVTPGGKAMSVAMTNCGAWGWISDRAGYRYQGVDPLTGGAWPAMPQGFETVAVEAAAAAGYAGFAPEACLVNRYAPGARMAPHQDRDEADLGAPIVSVSLGLSATVLWGGLSRGDRLRRHGLHHGDVVVWGGPARLAFHGVAPLQPGDHPAAGALRYNLTFRKTR